MSSDNSLDNLIILDNSNPAISRVFIFQMIFPIIGGFMFGYDTGVISGALILLKIQFRLNTLQQEFIVSSTILSAAVSSLLAGWLSRKFGRKKVMITSTIFFMVGSLLMGVSVTIWMLILGRVIIGIGVGLSATCCPVYISENSPEKIRGRLIVLYQISITAGMFIAALTDAAFYYTGSEGWRYMLGAASIPAVIEFIGMVNIPESYRWLLSQNRIGEAKQIIQSQKLIPEDFIDKYIDDIIEANRIIEKEVNEHLAENGSLICEIFKDKVAKNSLFIGCSLQMFAQIIGINTIMYYTASVIKMSGVDENYKILWLSALVTFFNFMPSFVGFILIDKIGRRKLALISLFGVFISLVILAITFQILITQSSPVMSKDPFLNTTSEVRCSTKTNCDSCIRYSECGFCYITLPNQPYNIVNSTCLANTYKFSTDSLNGWCAKNSTNWNKDAKWSYDVCKSKYSGIIILGMIFYLITFSIGMGPIPWTISSEIYPLWCRSTNMALSTATNWTFNLIISLSFLSLTEAITKFGVFWLYSSFTILGFVFVYRYMPETNQKTLEEINESLKI